MEKLPRTPSSVQSCQKDTHVLIDKNITAILQDLKSISITFIVASLSGIFLNWLTAPAPYLLGSLAGVWILSSKNKSLKEAMGIPRWFQIGIILGLGTLIGANFQPNSLELVSTWIPSVLSMFIATIVATAIGLIYLTKLRKYEFNLALLSCIPGGQAEVILISRELTEKDYVVALFHLVRVTLVFCFVPIMLAFVQGVEAVRSSNVNLAAMPSILDAEIRTLFYFAAISILSLPIAKYVRLPMPHLLGPLAVSSILHITGMIALPRINEFLILAQMTIGGIIGVRLASVNFHEIAKYLKDAVFSTLLVVSAFALMATLTAFLLDVQFLRMLLAFIPGGFYEVTLLSLIFGFDVAFVAFHHSIRVVLVFLLLPLTISKIHKKV